MVQFSTSGWKTNIPIAVPIKIRVDDPFIRITFSGNVTKADMINAFGEVAKLEAESRPILDRLTDLSGVVEREWDFQTIMRMAKDRRERVFPNKFKSAIVAPSPVDFGFARMFQTLNDNPQIDIQIFKTSGEAEAWLALKD